MTSFYIVTPQRGLVITELWLKNKRNSQGTQVLDKELQANKDCQEGTSPLPRTGPQALLQLEELSPETIYTQAT